MSVAASSMAGGTAVVILLLTMLPSSNPCMNNAVVSVLSTELIIFQALLIQLLCCVYFFRTDRGETAKHHHPLPSNAENTKFEAANAILLMQGTNADSVFVILTIVRLIFLRTSRSCV